MAVKVERNGRQNLGMFMLHRLQRLRIEAKSGQNRRCDLCSLNGACHHAGAEARVRYQHDEFRIVVREAAMFGELGMAPRVGDADIRRQNNVSLRGSPLGGSPVRLNNWPIAGPAKISPIQSPHPARMYRPDLTDGCGHLAPHLLHRLRATRWRSLGTRDEAKAQKWCSETQG